MDPEVKVKPVFLLPRSLLIAAIVLLSVLIAGFAGFYFWSKTTRAVVTGLVADPATNLDSTVNRTNLVVMGTGGEGHQGGDLTDSMIFISLSHLTHSVTMISIPRDIWVTSLKAKVNTAYHYGNEKRSGGGLDLARSAVSEILGQPVHYSLSLDFAGFVKVIDALGGIDVDVLRTFDDYKYPIPGREDAEPESERYTHLHFDAGMTHMDGTTALQFARSRHAEGDEGTDFARSSRQQKIILATRDKILSSETLLSYDTLKNLLAGITSSMDTDIEEDEFASLFRFFLAYENSSQSLHAVDITSLVSNPKNTREYGGQWVLVPSVSWDNIYTYVAQNLAE